MATSELRGVVDFLKKIAQKQEATRSSDSKLLEAFIRGGEEVAFQTIMRRHGAMVMGVCRRVLHNRHDAEDAFQATFLVLARKAASISSRKLLANWLYGVAFKTALKAHAAKAKRRTRERQVSPMPEPEAAREQLWNDLQPLLDAEISRLPEKYRVPIILCDLEGKTGKEAARQLGWPEGTLSGRLSRGRNMLAKRLKKRGIELSSATLAGLIAQQTTSAAVPASLVFSTAKAATIIAAGSATAAGIISANVASLTKGVLKAMLLTKLKTGVGVLFVTAALGVVAAQWPSGTAAEGYQEKKDVTETKAQPPAAPPQQQAKPPVKEIKELVPGPGQPIRYVLAVKLVETLQANQKVTYESEINVPEGASFGIFLAPINHVGVFDNVKKPPSLATGISVDVKIRRLNSSELILDLRCHDEELTVGKPDLALMTGSTSRVVQRIKLGEPMEIEGTLQKKSGLIRRHLTVTAQVDSRPQPGGPVGKYTEPPTGYVIEPPLPPPLVDGKPFPSGQATPPPPTKKVGKGYELKHQSAVRVAQLLQDFYKHHIPIETGIFIKPIGVNTLFVSVPLAEMARIDALIHMLDESPAPTGQTKPVLADMPPLGDGQKVTPKQLTQAGLKKQSFPVKYESSAVIAQLMSDNYLRHLKEPYNIRIDPDDTNKIVLVVAEPANLVAIGALIQWFDEGCKPIIYSQPLPAGKEPPALAICSFPLKRLSAHSVVQLVGEFWNGYVKDAKNVRATYDERTNIVFVQASLTDLNIIRSLILLLDENKGEFAEFKGKLPPIPR